LLNTSFAHQLQIPAVPRAFAMHVVFLAQLQGMIEQFLLDAGERFALGQNGIVDLLQKPRHRREHVRTHFLDLRSDVVVVLQEVDAHARPLVEVHQHALVDVAQRQKAHATRAHAHTGSRSALASTLPEDVVVAQHNALGPAGSAAGS
jgi:hypothetical protein